MVCVNVPAKVCQMSLCLLFLCVYISFNSTHLTLVRQADVKDPEVEMVHTWLNQFENRVNVLFSEGHIMTMKKTYTAQIVAFYRDPSVVFAAKHAILFTPPDTSDADMTAKIQH